MVGLVGGGEICPLFFLGVKMYDYNIIKERFDDSLSRIFPLTEAGEVRESKGNLCVNLCIDIIKEAARQLNIEDIEVEHNKIVSTEIENTEVDVVVSYKDKEIMYIECKSYTDITMFKRFLLEVLGLQSKNKDAKVCIFQLENSLGGDYNEDKSLESQNGSIKVNKFLEMVVVDIDIITMLDGKRSSTKPIHKEQYRKSFSEYKYKRAIEYFKNTLSELTK